MERNGLLVFDPLYYGIHFKAVSSLGFSGNGGENQLLTACSVLVSHIRHRTFRALYILKYLSQHVKRSSDGRWPYHRRSY